jgi:hypothetical protein
MITNYLPDYSWLTNALDSPKIFVCLKIKNEFIPGNFIPVEMRVEVGSTRVGHSSPSPTTSWEGRGLLSVNSK